MDVFLNLEHLILRLQVHTDADIQRLVLVGQCLVVGILHITASKLAPLFHVHIVLHEFFVKILDREVLTLQINHRTFLSFLVDEHDGTDTGLLGYEGIVSTEVGSNMHDTGTVVCGHIVTGNHLKGIAQGLDGWHQLLVLHTHQVSTLVAGYDAVGNQLVALLVLRHLTAVSDGTLSREVGIQTSLGQDYSNFLGCIGVVGLDGHIVNLRTYAEGRVGCQRPRCRSPREEVRCAPVRHLGLGILHLEHRRACRVLHVAVAARLVQFMA